MGFARLRERLGGTGGGGPWRVWPGCLTWGLGAARVASGLKADLAIAFKAYECVLSEGLAVGRGLLLPVCFWAVDGSCAWRGLWDAPARA